MSCKNNRSKVIIEGVNNMWIGYSFTIVKRGYNWFNESYSF